MPSVERPTASLSVSEETAHKDSPKQNATSPSIAVPSEIQSSVASLAQTRIPSEALTFDYLVNSMVAENTSAGKASGKLFAPSAAIYIGAQAVDTASAISGMGILSGLMGLKSILSRAVAGREAENAARTWVSNNADRGWGPFKLIHRVVTAPARFLSNMSFHPRIFNDLEGYAGKERTQNIDTLSPGRAMELAAMGAAAASIYKSAEIMAPHGLDPKVKLGHLTAVAETGKAIYDKIQAKIIPPERKILFAESIKRQAQGVEDALYTTARTGYIMGTNILLGTVAWTWNAMGRSFSFVEKAWKKKVLPFVQNAWDKANVLAKDIGSEATNLWNKTTKAVEPLLSPGR